MPRELWRLTWRQIAPILVSIVLVFSLLGLLGGLVAQRNWHSINQPQNRDAYTSELTYDRQLQRYVADNGSTYATKSAYLKDYLQVMAPSTERLRSSYNPEFDLYLTILSVLIGLGAVMLSRYRHFQEFWLTLGYQRQQITTVQFSSYALAIGLGTLLHVGLTQAVLYARVPHQYFTYFSWNVWVWHAGALVLAMIALFSLAYLCQLIVTNFIFNGILLYVVVTKWSAVLHYLHPISERADDYARYFGHHVELSVLTLLLITAVVFGLSWWLSRYVANEWFSSAVTISWLRAPVCLMVSLALALLFGSIGVTLLAGRVLYGYVLIGGIALVGTATWLYRPRWLQFGGQLIQWLR